MNCKISTAKLFLFLLLLTVVACDVSEENNQDQLAENVVESKRVPVPEIPKETKIDSIDQKMLTSVLWENDYFKLEITDEYALCGMAVYDAHLNLDTIETTSEMGCSMMSIPFSLTNLKLDSVKVEQTRLESIAISQPPSDGFDRAGLNELILQSNWVAYESKNGMYVPFSNEDSRFVIKGKPKLTTEFITNILEKSNRAVAPNLLEGFMKTDQQAYWVNCTTIIRITGLDIDGNRIAKYVVDNELCLQD